MDTTELDRLFNDFKRHHSEPVDWDLVGRRLGKWSRPIGTAYEDLARGDHGPSVGGQSGETFIMSAFYDGVNVRLRRCDEYGENAEVSQSIDMVQVAEFMRANWMRGDDAAKG